MYFGPNRSPPQIRDQDQNHMLKPCMHPVCVCMCTPSQQTGMGNENITDGSTLSLTVLQLTIQFRSVHSKTFVCISVGFSLIPNQHHWLQIMTSTSQNALEPNPQQGITLTLKKKKPDILLKKKKPQGDCL